MTIAYVPSQSCSENFGSAQVGSNTVTGNAVSNGNTIIVFAAGISQSSGNPYSWRITDNAGNTYSGEAQGNDANGMSYLCYICPSASGSPTQFTVNGNGDTFIYMSMIVDVFSGCDPNSFSTGIGVGSSSAQNPGSGTDAIASSTTTSISNGSPIWSACLVDDNTTPGIVPGTGFTAAQSATSNYPPVYSEYKLGSGFTSPVATWTDATEGATGNNFYTVASLELAAASGGSSSTTGTLSETLGALTSSSTLGSKDKATLSSTLGALTGPGESPGSWVINGITYVPSASGTYNTADTTALWQPTINEIPAGATVLVYMAGTLPAGGFGTWQLTDNAGNYYTQTNYIGDGNPGFATAAYYCRGVQGNPTGFIFQDVAFGSSVEGPIALVDVFLGIPPTYVVDDNSINLGTPPGLVTDGVTSGTLTTTAPNDFLWAATIPFSGLGPGIAIGTGFTEAQNGGYLASEYTTSTPLGNTQATFTPVSPNDGSYWETAAIAFKSEPFNGVVNTTLGNLGPYITASIPGGSFAASDTLGSLTLASAGTVTDKLSASDTLGALTGAATGIFQPTRHATVSDTLGSLTFSGGLASDDPGNLHVTLGALRSTATLVWQEQYSGGGTLGSLVLSASLSQIDKLTSSQTLGALTLHSTAHNFTPLHLTLSVTLGSLGATFLTGKTKFTTVNPRTHLTVLGYQPGTPPIQNLQVG